jgi:hypothetical protein
MVRPLAVIASRHGATWDVGDQRCRGLRRAGQEGYLSKEAHAVMCLCTGNTYRLFY